MDVIITFILGIHMYAFCFMLIVFIRELNGRDTKEMTSTHQKVSRFSLCHIHIESIKFLISSV